MHLAQAQQLKSFIPKNNSELTTGACIVHVLDCFRIQLASSEPISIETAQRIYGATQDSALSAKGAWLSQLLADSRFCTDYTQMHRFPGSSAQQGLSATDKVVASASLGKATDERY